MNLNLIKTAQGHLVPASEEDQEFLSKVKIGQVVSADFKKKRNYKFHKKLFALLNYAFDNFEPVTEYKGQPVQKNRDRFREEITIMTGHYDVVATIGGEVRKQAKSISFASMDDEQFSRLYSGFVDVILQNVLTNYTRDDFKRVEDQILGFV